MSQKKKKNVKHIIEHEKMRLGAIFQPA